MSLEDFRLLSFLLATWGAVLSTVNYFSARSNKVEARVFRRSPREDKSTVVVVIYGRGARSFVEDIAWKIRDCGKLREVHRREILEFCPVGATQKYEWDASGLNNEETVYVEVKTGGGQSIRLSSRDPSKNGLFARALEYLVAK